MGDNTLTKAEIIRKALQLAGAFQLITEPDDEMEKIWEQYPTVLAGPVVDVIAKFFPLEIPIEVIPQWVQDFDKQANEVLAELNAKKADADEELMKKIREEELV